ncbi:brix domain-containing protein 1 [Coccidioides immitis H538.4]|uniref:Ribosome production factor 2 homolog n=1 Tax=Coccidioides immitis H538.4 TaxID=396776 RepID=A0A0J8UXB1_COCIT|nr:brix domain-containing protein 1 [Coccidioides immitis H538.4]
MMLREVKARNPRTARILKSREPQLIEQPKRILLLHGPKCPFPLRTALKVFHSLTQPHSILFHKKNANIHPFENAASLEFLATKNECGIVIWGSSNKKRPNCVTLVRIFDAKVLEMCELLLLGTQEQMEQDAAVRGSGFHAKLNVGLGMKPMILFAGSVWADSTVPVFGMLKKKALGRIREADPGAMKEAMKQGKRPQDLERTKKNISMDSIGDKIGRVHLGRQDLSALQTRKMKGLKRRNGIEGEDQDANGDMMDIDQVSEEGSSKKPRID